MKNYNIFNYKIFNASLIVIQEFTNTIKILKHALNHNIPVKMQYIMTYNLNIMMKMTIFVNNNANTFNFNMTMMIIIAHKHKIV